MSIKTTTQTATQRQIMVCFAYLAYCGETITSADPNFANVEQTIFNSITGAISPGAASPLAPLSAPNDTWAVVWGPAVYTVPGALYQDNMMYVVQNQADSSQFAIAIRGTNFSSDLDWLLEDFDVLQMMPWPNVAGANISESTNIDLQILLSMQGAITSNGSYANGGYSSLMSFLSSQTANGPVSLGVTGHSLGGCLAATLGLYLNDNQSQWDAAHATQPSTLYAVTFAGPTAGNAAFAAYSNAQFQQQYSKNPAPNWNTNWGTVTPTNCDVVQCNMDVVPLMWVSENMSSGSQYSNSPVFNIYSPSNGCPDPPYASTSPNDAQGLDFSYPGVSFDGSGDVNTNLADLEDGAGDYTAWTEFVVPTLLPLIAGYFNTAGTQYTQLDSYDVLAGQFISSPPGGWPAGLSFPVAGSTGGYNSLKVFMQAFAAEAGAQHSLSYPQLLGVTNLNSVVNSINNAG